MTWMRRKASEADMYHVMIRGTGRQLIFEDDADRERFLSAMGDLLLDGKVDLLAWCLMGNHVHLLVRASLDDLAAFMRKLCQSYAQYFNKRYDRVGHLTQGRYKSVPIETDTQLLQTVRYIHLNPVEAGLSRAEDYPWSSYREYAGGCEGPCEKGLVLEMLGGVEGFVRFHDEGDDSEVSRRSLDVGHMGDERARRVLEEVLADAGLPSVPTDDRAARDAVLAALKGKGLSIRQIERLTGIGRNIISRAK